MTGEKIKVIKGDLPESLHMRFKILCAKKNRTMGDVVAEIIEAWVLEQENEEKGK
ncbi:MAG: hypothetical protein KME46_32670 [Brasilonema angustatum HA4187-MV1]|jgi:predicted DNA-binding protein|nr:hypothetical protein [Brasilonema angustatum HA4187-MV1]